MRVLFYEKPGCVNNTRQKALLLAAGLEVEARNLLAEAWTAPFLRSFFGMRPVAEWFNRSAPAVTAGDVDPAGLNEHQALALMLADPLLIRRPLLDVDGWRSVGFEAADVMALLGIDLNAAQADESCPRRDGHRCD
ncbi:ArsC/Spx/MgsR family protein [Sulfurivermis fontis]|uniref:ArsC/Spx/MgsR family protein n=1 Tax=Sulfurivermis fontis TaxID=1972068 RepID=UPI000FDA6D63|nr:ArsC/Spx/MgsR family protein [Sulfurivermis fontis]